MHATLPLLEATAFPGIRRGRLETLQVNLGYRCNQSCVHCHVNAGPTRSEQMDWATIAVVLEVQGQLGLLATLDVTGGAPELNPNFRHLVRRARALGVHVIDRCNLTILEEPGHEDLAQFLAAQRVEIVASLPCYTEELVDRQRGKGVYEPARDQAPQRPRLRTSRHGTDAQPRLQPAGRGAAARAGSPGGRLQAHPR